MGEVKKAWGKESITDNDHKECIIYGASRKANSATALKSSPYGCKVIPAGEDHEH